MTGHNECYARLDILEIILMLLPLLCQCDQGLGWRGEAMESVSSNIVFHLYNFLIRKETTFAFVPCLPSHTATQPHIYYNKI